KIDEYYEKTTSSPAYILAMGMCSALRLQAINGQVIVLNPREKLGYFKRHWPADLQDAVVKCIEDIVSSIAIFVLEILH
ncbi:hypothetical protein H0H92_001753, partial [Tricholoma furcatifolium]